MKFTAVNGLTLFGLIALLGLLVTTNLSPKPEPTPQTTSDVVSEAQTQYVTLSSGEDSSEDYVVLSPEETQELLRLGMEIEAARDKWKELLDEREEYQGTLLSKRGLKGEVYDGCVGCFSINFSTSLRSHTAWHLSKDKKILFKSNRLKR